ncbi:MAG: HAMP domain-containing sensor histidine kinase [Actinomycetota bacterium]|jgi:two-component system sensor histidine kinase MprB|nr:two-component sensor histidine kinase [Acidimicrobiaceae bacterium]MEC7915206.1 HAMP domain-containing sensor histidine kinase [Actinomycetota bacterium]
MSFRTRIAVLIAAVVAVVVAAVAGVFLYMARGKALDSLDGKLRTRAASAVQLGDKLGRPQEFDRRLFGQYLPDDVLLQVFDTRGRIWASNVEPLPISADHLAIARGRLPAKISTTEVVGHRMRVLTLPLKLPGRAMMVARPMDEVDEQLAGLWRISLQIFVIGVAGAGVAGFIVAGRVVRPVKRLTEAATNVAVTQDVNQPINVQSDDEFGQLAASFNQMLGALSASREQQHRLVTDASHELRTPITSLRTNLEHIHRSATVTDDERQEILDDVLFELDELTGLVTELVDLATDRHQMGEPLRVELDELVDAVVQRHRRRTSSAINYTAEPCAVMAVPALLERAVSNMLDNALKWSPPNAPVQVEVARGSVVVRDEGPGIAADERERVFERFYRTDKARPLPGSGLGLSIVRHVAESFDGQARIIDGGTPGTAVELSLPQIS